MTDQEEGKKDREEKNFVQERIGMELEKMVADLNGRLANKPVEAPAENLEGMESGRLEKYREGIAEMRVLIKAANIMSQEGFEEERDFEGIERKMMDLAGRLANDKLEPAKPNAIEKNIFIKRKGKFEEDVPYSDNEYEEKWKNYAEALPQSERAAIEKTEDFITYCAFINAFEGIAANNSYVNEGTVREFSPNMLFAYNKERNDPDFEEYVSRLLTPVDNRPEKPVNAEEQKEFERLKAEYEGLEKQLKQAPHETITKEEFEEYSKADRKVRRAVPRPEGYLNPESPSDRTKIKEQEERRDAFIKTLSADEQRILARVEKVKEGNTLYNELHGRVTNFWNNLGLENKYAHYFHAEQGEKRKE